MSKRDSAISTAQAVKASWTEEAIVSQDLYRAATKVEKLFAVYEGYKKRRNIENSKIAQRRASYLQGLEKVFDISKQVDILEEPDEICGNIHTKQKTPMNEKLTPGNINNSNSNSPMKRVQQQLPGTSSSNVPLIVDRHEIAAENFDLLDNDSESHDAVYVLQPNAPIRAQQQLPGTSSSNVPLIVEQSGAELPNSPHVYLTRSSLNNLHEDAEETSSNDDGDDDPEDPDFAPQERNKEKKRMSKVVASMVDRLNLSSRDASALYLTMADSLGVNPKECICSTSTVYRIRKRNRVERANEIWQNFQPTSKLALHWDGKTFMGKIRDKRLAIVVSDGENAKLLGVPQVLDGEGRTAALCVQDMLENWGLTDQIQNMCCDTENTNTGVGKGAAIFLEQFLKKELLLTPCRHHIFEIILAAVFVNTVEPKGLVFGPTIKIFEDFCKAFFDPEFVKTQYRGCRSDRFFKKLISDEELDRIRGFCRDQLLKHNPRSDYVELLKLTLILVLKPEDSQGMNVQAPGSYNRARFMGRILYCIKIYLYRSQLVMEDSVLDSIRRFLVFFLKSYIENWFKAGIAISSPYNDLKMLKNISELREILPTSAEAALQKLLKHLWYLSETVVALSFFDDDVPNVIKEQMVARLESRPIQGNPKRAQLTYSTREFIDHLSISEFVSSKTMRFFAITGINSEFLAIPPHEWKRNQIFQEARDAAKKMVVVNDCAERSIALYQNYRDRCKEEIQMASLIQVAEEERKIYKKMRKGDIIEQLAR